MQTSPKPVPVKKQNKRQLPYYLLDTPEKPRVLLIEDDRTTRRMVRASLEEDCHITIAGNASLAVNLYRHLKPDVVFLDIQLPDGNGHSLLNWILSIDPTAFVVMLSGHSDNENVSRAAECGAKGFITKPFEQDKLKFFIDKCQAD